ncbi:pentatricopeptide repeat-containing protein At3g03580 [Papaver somniferum]|uniref:pentatricopeptide repeat-containing protein At3g03580 n=1 Tax=Papaver somniferum TaxID=3469 RepID=UPI000E6FED54|nr:pentatricopeptide repeat-containing protein At3g03580 [Papaver somniferum]
MIRRFYSGNQEFIRSLISKSLSIIKSHRQLTQVHSVIITSGFEQFVFFSTKLITKYSQFRDCNSSRSVFDQVSNKNNVFLWNSIIRALTQNGIFSESLELFFKMRSLGLRPDNFTFPSVINACAGLSDMENGKFVHECILEMGFGSDLFVCNALIDMYSRFRCLDEARNLFDKMSQRDIVSWNCLISGYSANKEWIEAVEIFSLSRNSGLLPDSFTVSSILPAFGNMFYVEEGLIIHGLIHKIGVDSDRLINNGLISMYCKFESLNDARKVFDEMGSRDNVSWNTMICGYSQVGLFSDAIMMFKDMIIRFKPDLLTLTDVLKACGHMKDLEFGKFVHEYMKSKGFNCSTLAGNILITMYARCGDLCSSLGVFDQLPVRDSVSWNSLISGYIDSKCYGEVIKLFKMMNDSEVKPDSVTHLMLLSMCTEQAEFIHGKVLHCNVLKMGFNSSLTVSNAILGMYAKCGSSEDSLKQFEEMKIRDAVTWNTLISGSVHSGNCELGLKVISQMRTEGLIPDCATMLSILPACSFLAIKKQGKEIHGSILKFGLDSEVHIGNALIEMYSKCGSLQNALHVFNSLKMKDVVTWTALVSAYGMYGEGKKALRAFSEMESMGILPDRIAFVAIIYACSHSGLIQEGLQCFHQMKDNYRIKPEAEHYACVVDLLSRSGHLDEAEKFILEMPVKPDASIWGALLSACRSSTSGSQISERVSKRILGCDPNNTGYYILVSNVYAGLGKWEQVSRIRKSMKGKGLKKEVGCSWIEIQNRVYVFGTGNRYIEQSEEIHKLLKKLSRLMVKEGYVADKKSVLHDVADDEKMDMLCGHSERLAIAFGLLNTKPGTKLQIMKNLRVCGDCHTVTKYISKIMNRELLVRDGNRFHLFKDGVCSCGDFW